MVSSIPGGHRIVGRQLTGVRSESVVGPVASTCVLCLTVVAVLASCAGKHPPVPPVAERATLPAPSEADRPSAVASGGHGLPLPTHMSHAERGSVYFARYCTECHGIDGRADGVRASALRPRPTDFSDNTYMREQRPAWFYRALTRGVTGSAMARWDHRLDELDRWDTAYYVYSIGVEPGAIEAGQQVYARWCESCHGADGNAEPGAQLATAELARMSRAEIAAAVSGVHDPADVPESAADAEAVASFVATFLYEPSPGFNATR